MSALVQRERSAKRVLVFRKNLKRHFIKLCQISLRNVIYEISKVRSRILYKTYISVNSSQIKKRIFDFSSIFQRDALKEAYILAIYLLRETDVYARFIR